MMTFKTEFKHIRFEKTAQHKKTSEWVCLNKSENDDLGVIKWYGSWRQYVFYPEREVLFSAGCLKSLALFMADLREHERTANAGNKQPA